jgi:glucose-6-phosphate-specific signal transduction histidine kinase
MLPFIAGVAAGAAIVVAVNNNKKIKKALSDGAKKAQGYAEQGYDKSKELASEIKSNVGQKVECLKSKKEQTSQTKDEETKDDK